MNNLNATANANPSADERHRIFSISLRLHLRLRLHFKRVNRAMQRKGMSRVQMQTVMGTLFTKNGLRKTGNHTYPSSPYLSVRHVLKPGAPEHPGTPEHSRTPEQPKNASTPN